MMRRVLWATAALLLAPLLVLAEHVIVLKSGQRLQAQRPHTIEGNYVVFTGPEDQVQRVPLGAVDLEATERANRRARPRPRVWTNEHLERLSDVPINIVGRPGAARVTGEAETTAEGQPAAQDEEREPLPPVEKTKRYWQEQAKQIYDRMDEIDRRTQSLRNNLNRAASNEVSLLEDAQGVQVEDTLRRLEEQKRQLEDQLDLLRRQAERQGIAPGHLRRPAVERALQEPRE